MLLLWLARLRTLFAVFFTEDTLITAPFVFFSLKSQNFPYKFSLKFGRINPLPERMKSKETEPLFLPAAICTSVSTVAFLGGLCSGNLETMVTASVLWGAGVGLWVENGRRGGTTPWPRNMEELTEMLQALKKE